MEAMPPYYILAIQAAIEAGMTIMEVFDSNEMEIRLKEDESPVTKADLLSSEVISDILSSSGIPILSEEVKLEKYINRKNWELLWIVDPLDGTKEFIKRTNEFAVSIGLVRDKEPEFGVIYLPTTREVFFGGRELGSYTFEYDEDRSVGRQLDKVIELPRTSTPENILIVTGGKETDESFYSNSNLLKNHTYKETQFIKLSSAIKFCRIAEGKMDVYPRDYPCMEWDTAAGQAIVNGVGKEIYNINTEKPITYNNQDLRVPFFLLK